MDTTVRQQFADRTLRTIARTRHPSHQMLDRLERSLRTRGDLEAYGWLVRQLTEGQRHPSPRMLDRLDQCALTLELLDQYGGSNEGSDDKEHA